MLQKWMVQPSLCGRLQCKWSNHVETPHAPVAPYRQRITPNHGPTKRLLWIPVRRNPGRVIRNKPSRNRQRDYSLQPIPGTMVCNKTNRSNFYKRTARLTHFLVQGRTKWLFMHGRDGETAQLLNRVRNLTLFFINVTAFKFREFVASTRGTIHVREVENVVVQQKRGSKYTRRFVVS